MNRIKALLKFKIDKLIEKRLKFREDWIKKKRCPCVNNLREGITINCKHYNSKAKDKFKKEVQSIIHLGIKFGVYPGVFINVLPKVCSLEDDGVCDGEHHYDKYLHCLGKCKRLSNNSTYSRRR